ncbi:MAG: hypothetical protein LBT01_04210, partial [Spirochaetaceae bacterium]|nr:hypothetical protein [Spirochaetaceae bacterium]
PPPPRTPPHASGPKQRNAVSENYLRLLVAVPDGKKAEDGREFRCKITAVHEADTRVDAIGEMI